MGGGIHKVKLAFITKFKSIYQYFKIWKDSLTLRKWVDFLVLKILMKVGGLKERFLCRC